MINKSEKYGRDGEDIHKQTWTISWSSLFFSTMAVVLGAAIPICIAITYLYWVGAGGLKC